MSSPRNLDSLRSEPDLSAPLTPRQMERQIANLLAKVSMLEERLAKVERRGVSKPVIIDMIGCSERRTIARTASFERRLKKLERHYDASTAKANS